MTIHPSDLFGTEAPQAETLAIALDTYTNDREELERLINYARGLVSRSTERVESARITGERNRRVATARGDLRDYDRRALTRALESLHGDEPKLTTEAQQWETWARLIIHVGCLTGHASDTHTLMRELDGSLPFDTDVLFRDVSSGLREDGGTFPEPVSGEEAIVSAWHRYGADLPIHPSDPRLSDGWELIWRTAKRADLCAVWDELALTLGVPNVDVTRSGYVRVTGTFAVSVYVEGITDTDDIDIDLQDVLENLDRYSVDVEDYDTSDLEWD